MILKHTLSDIRKRLESEGVIGNRGLKVESVFDICCVDFSNSLSSYLVSLQILSMKSEVKTRVRL
jgi:hypothetical protein